MHDAFFMPHIIRRCIFAALRALSARLAYKKEGRVGAALCVHVGG
jgi:hypothetical protein